MPDSLGTRSLSPTRLQDACSGPERVRNGGRDVSGISRGSWTRWRGDVPTPPLHPRNRLHPRGRFLTDSIVYVCPASANGQGVVPGCCVLARRGSRMARSRGQGSGRQETGSDEQGASGIQKELPFPPDVARRRGDERQRAQEPWCAGRSWGGSWGRSKSTRAKTRRRRDRLDAYASKSSETFRTGRVARISSSPARASHRDSRPGER